MASGGAGTVANGWRLKCTHLFLRRYEELIALVEQLAEQDPEGFVHHPATKLFESVSKAIEQRVPADPASSQFQCATLRNGGRWRRVKKGLPQRYRLFFQFNSVDKIIIYVWLNDDGCLRKAGDKSDVYAVFLGMTQQGKIPQTYKELLQGCTELPKKAS